MKSPTSVADQRRVRGWLRPWHVALMWGLAMLPLVLWGLPSARYDALLFDGQAWPPERYQPTAATARLSERDAGADTDMDPLAHRDEIIDLTVDEAGRAQILTRYRLYSHQPDEMITFRALQRMKPRKLDFDPRLFQYGGAFIYLVGASLGAASGLGLVTVTSDLGGYLTNPGLFAAFYIVARIVTLAFGAASLPLVFRIAARAGGRRAGWIAMVLTAFAPVFICGSLEAKPHLPAVFFCLLTIDLALRRGGELGTRRALALGAAAGGACGMVLTGAAALITLVATWLLSPRTPRSARHFGIAIAAAAGVYGVTNPYVIWNLLFNRAVLASNLSNSTAMYSLAHPLAGALRVGELLSEGTGILTLLAAVLGMCLLLAKHRSGSVVAGASGAATLVLCAAIGANKPPEFARFLALPAVLACVAAAALLARIARRSALTSAALIAMAILTGGTHRYIRTFWLDTGGIADTRTIAANWIAKNVPAGDSIGVLQEPAPYCVPPLAFATRKILLLPQAPPATLHPEQLPEWLIYTWDSPLRETAWREWARYYQLTWSEPLGVTWPASPIAWANKPVFVYRRMQ